MVRIASPRSRQAVLPRLVAGSWLCALLVAACGRGTTGTATPPPALTAGATPAATTAPATPADTGDPPPSPTPAPTPRPSVFTLGLVQAPQTLDPADALDETALIITRHLYDGLFAFEPGTTRPVPALAERFSVSPDGLTWTFDLRPGVTFSDGTPLTAAAAARNFERWLSAEPPARYLYWQTLFGGFANEAGPDGEPLSVLEAVTTRGDDTLVLALTRPAASLPNSLALPSFGLVSPDVLDSPDPTAALNAASAGTGPYVLAGRPQPDLVRLVRSPNHWDPARASGPDELVFKVIPDDTQRLLALQTGEIEGLAHLNPTDYAAVESGANSTRLTFDPPNSVLYLGFNHARVPWHNLDCRLAVAHALDRARYTQAYFPGDAQVADAMQPPAVWGHSAAGEYAYDPALARQHWETCTGTGAFLLPTTISLYVPPVARPYLPDPAGLGQAIQADLAAVGITVTIASPDWQTQWLPDVHGGRADLFLLGWNGLNGDPDSYLCPLFCGAEGAFNTGEGGVPAPPDEELARLLAEAQTVTAPDQRATLYAQAHARIFAAAPAVPLAMRQSAWAFRADVAGNVPSPIESVFWGLRLAPAP